jgi:hypothetical protein
MVVYLYTKLIYIYNTHYKNYESSQKKKKRGGGGGRKQDYLNRGSMIFSFRKQLRSMRVSDIALISQ